MTSSVASESTPRPLPLRLSRKGFGHPGQDRLPAGPPGGAVVFGQPEPGPDLAANQHNPVLSVHHGSASGRRTKESTYVRLELIMSRILPISSKTALPAIKFFKDAVEDILAGRKTLEPRPRSPSWTSRLEKVGQASFTYGPRFGAPTVFATARIIDITVRPFDSATLDDLRRIGYDWANRSREEFVTEYTSWFTRELEKGYPVAWISFEVIC